MTTLAKKGVAVLTQQELNEMKESANLIPKGTSLFIQPTAIKLEISSCTRWVSRGQPVGSTTIRVSRKGSKKSDLKSLKSRNSKGEESMSRKELISKSFAKTNSRKPTRNSSRIMKESELWIVSCFYLTLFREGLSNLRWRTTSRISKRKENNIIINKLLNRLGRKMKRKDVRKKRKN